MSYQEIHGFDRIIETIAHNIDIKWVFEGDTELRGYDKNGRCFCPITAACHTLTDLYYPPTDVSAAVCRANIKATDCNIVIDLADQRGGTDRPGMEEEVEGIAKSV